jgi:hypothetical protein
LTAPIGGQKARFVCLVYACLELPCDRAVYGGSVLKEEHGRRERQVSGELYDCKQPFGVEQFCLKQSVKFRLSNEGQRTSGNRSSGVVEFNAPVLVSGAMG